MLQVIGSSVSQNPLSFAKITPPKVSGLFPRTRLFSLLDAGMRMPLIWISGPPGSGKTSMVINFIQTRQLPCLWYQLDEGDEDLPAFFRCLGLAAQAVGSAGYEPLPSLTPEYSSEIPAFTRRYFTALGSRLEMPFLLVFDNYQEVVPDSALHEVVRTGIESLPAGCTAILISRSEPNSMFARMCVNGQVQSIGWDELQLTSDESLGLAHLLRQDTMPLEVIMQLHQRSQGWAAGLALLLGQASKNGIKTHLGDMASPTVFYDYFDQEVFSKADPTTQAVLIKSAFLPFITAPVVERISGRADAERILLSLVRRNFFITRRSTDSAATYQYHPLFREFLLAVAPAHLSSDEMIRTKRQAAEILEDSGDFENAAEIYLSLKEWKRLIALVLKCARPLMAEGRTNVLENWLLSIPEAARLEVPWCWYWLGRCGLYDRPGRARQQFEKAYALFMSHNDLVGMISCCIGIINSCVIERDDFNLLPEWTEELVRLHELANEVIPHDLEAELICSMTMSLTYHNPGHPDMQRWIGQARHLMKTAPEIELRVVIGSFVVLYYSWVGASSEMQFIVDELQMSLDSSQSTPVAMIQFHGIKAVSLSYFGFFDEALECVVSALALANSLGIHVFDSKLLAQGAYSSLLAGNFSQAHEFIANLSGLTDFAQKARACHYHFIAGWEAYSGGRIPEAKGHVNNALEISRHINCPYASLVTRQLASLVHFDSEEPDSAFSLLAEARQVGQSMQSKVGEYVCNLIEAYFLLIHDPASKAGLETLRSAFSLGRTADILSHFGVQRDVITFLCIKALENGIEREQVRRVITTFKLMPDHPPIELEQWPWPLKIYTMGRFGLVKEGVPLHFAGKVQHKPMEMLKALIAFGGRNVTEEKLSDHLWPNAAGDDAHKSFVVTLHRLRRLLGDDRFILYSKGLLALNQHCCWVDAWAFNRFAGQARTLLNGGLEDQSPAITSILKAISLYNGHFLAGDTDRQWSLSMRESLRGKMLHIISTAGHYWEEAGEWRKAVECYLKGLETDDLVEDNYQRLMVCHQQMGDRGAILSIYKRCCTTLAMFGVKPSAKTKSIYETLVYGSIG